MVFAAAKPVEEHWTGLDVEGRDFAATHLAGGLAGLGAALLWAVLGEPKGLAWLALVWLASPLALAALAIDRAPLRWLQAASSINTILLLAGLAALSGGTHSAFLPWLVLAPVEAALSRRLLALILSILFGAAALGALGCLDAAGALPVFELAPEWNAALMAGSLIGCLLYAAGLALEVHGVHERAARKAAQSEASYRFLADNAADPIFRLTAAGTVLYASPAWQQLLVREPIDLIGQSIDDLLHTDDLASVHRALVRASYFGEEIAIECRAGGPDGEPCWIELKGRPVQRLEPQMRRRFALSKPAPKPVGGMDVIVIARDITERRRHEEALKRAIELAEAQSRAKSRFLANMSHELRTPLNSILGFAEMIARELFGPVGHPRYHEYALLIGESGQYLLNLINDILDVAKIEAGKYALERAPLNLAHTLERTLKVMMPQFREKGVQLAVEVAHDLPLVEADARAVRQILFNLLSNALKFTPAGGAAAIRLAPTNGAALIEVSDTGIGIAEADLKRLARPFEQAASPDVRSQLGTGLGLALVKSLAALHGGSLTIKSRLGHGTTITVCLPLTAPAHKTGAADIPQAA